MPANVMLLCAGILLPKEKTETIIAPSTSKVVLPSVRRLSDADSFTKCLRCSMIAAQTGFACDSQILDYQMNNAITYAQEGRFHKDLLHPLRGLKSKLLDA